MGGVINIVTSRPARRTVELKPQYGNRDSPKVDFFASDVWGKVGVAVDGSVLRHRRLPDRRRRPSAGSIDNNADGQVPELQRQGRVQPDRSACRRSSAPATSARTATTARSREVNDTRVDVGRAAACASRLPDESDLQATRLRRRRDVPQQLPRGDRAGATCRRAASCG